MSWQTIESAPKDGRWIVALVDGLVFPICWEDDEDDDGYAGWCSAGSGFGGVLHSLHNQVEGKPTHWMPLPALPSDPGIAIYKTSPGGNLDEQHASIECVTCGTTFSLNDPEAVAYHDQETHQARP